MDRFLVYLILIMVSSTSARMFCDRAKIPLEIGQWHRDLKHMDTVTVENPPVSVREGQIYVYENYFPDRIIEYIHVANLAKRSCGASATVKSGGLNTSGVLIVLQAAPHHEIRSTIDIWGVNMNKQPQQILVGSQKEFKDFKTRYLYNVRTVNHNVHNFSDFIELQ